MGTKNNFISDMIKSEQNSTPTDKHFNRTAFVFALLALTLISAFLGYTVTCLLNENIVTALIEQIWFVVFFVDAIFIYIALHLSVKQIIRQRFASSVASITMSVIALAMFIAVIIVGIFLYNKIYIPFLFYPF